VRQSTPERWGVVDLGADVDPIGDCEGDFFDEDASSERQAAVAKDNAALKAGLGQCLRNYQKQSSCERSNLCHMGSARIELPRMHLAGVPTWIRFGAL
jgi:hypothetical protein